MKEKDAIDNKRGLLNILFTSTLLTSIKIEPFKPYLQGKISRTLKINHKLGPLVNITTYLYL